MRPDGCWMQVSMLAVMVLCLNADGEESECTPVIEVKRNTTYKAAPGEELRIKCSVTLCEDKSPNVSWYIYESDFIHINSSTQSRIKTEWKQLNRTHGISYLIFKNTVRSDSGQFQCQIKGERSHVIHVSVSDEFRNRSTKNTDSEPTGWLYVCSAAGLATLVVVIAVISVAAMRGCKGKSKEEEQPERQYLAIPMVERPRPPPRGSPIARPCRRSIQKRTQDEEEEKGRGRSAVREEQETSTSIVYAALNHPLPPRGGARPCRPAEAPSEYAAIRVA